MEIVAYSESLHLQELTEIVHGMRHSERAYPPREDCGETVEDVEAWLRGSTAFARWVAVHEGKVVGHIALQEPDDYLKTFLTEHEITGKQSEISKFFVSPDCRKLGAGRLLFSHAVESSDHQVALAVLNGSLAAREFYVHHGMTELGIYHGKSGINHIFLENRVVLDEVSFPELDLTIQITMSV